MKSSPSPMNQAFYAALLLSLCGQAAPFDGDVDLYTSGGRYTQSTLRHSLMDTGVIMDLQPTDRWGLRLGTDTLRLNQYALPRLAQNQQLVQLRWRTDSDFLGGSLNWRPGYMRVQDSSVNYSDQRQGHIMTLNLDYLPYSGQLSAGGSWASSWYQPSIQVKQPGAYVTWNCVDQHTALTFAVLQQTIASASQTPQRSAELTVQHWPDTAAPGQLETTYLSVGGGRRIYAVDANQPIVYNLSDPQHWWIRLGARWYSGKAADLGYSIESSDFNSSLTGKHYLQTQMTLDLKVHF